MCRLIFVLIRDFQRLIEFSFSGFEISL